MFTGIITGIGHITEASPILQKREFADVGGKQLTIKTPEGYLDDVVLGDSIALNGACMTVTSFDAKQRIFTVDISAESLACTTGLAQADKRVNLEKAMRLGDRLGGHMVTGHVDGIGTVKSMQAEHESWKLEITAPFEIGRFLAYKGSVTVNGVSLTVNEVKDTAAKNTIISINLIPHTIENTTLNELKEGSEVNLEIDIVARYLDRMDNAGKNITTAKTAT